MFQCFEESVTRTGPDSLKSFITMKFDKFKKERKETKVKKEEKKKKQPRNINIKSLVRFSSMLLQYEAAFMQKSRLDFTEFKPSSPLGQHLLFHLHSTSTAKEMMSQIDQREDEKGHMILVR